MARFRMKFNRKFSINKVIAKLVGTILALYVGGEIMNEVADVINGTTNQFNKGFELIGWTVSDAGLVSATTGNGILAVIGIIGIASIVMEFVKFKL